MNQSDISEVSQNLEKEKTGGAGLRTEIKRKEENTWQTLSRTRM